MRNASEMIDCWLTQYERIMPSIHSNDELEIIYSNTPTRHIPKLEDFEIVKVIGCGGFSKVFQVRKKDTAMIFAMKVTRKEFVLEKGKAEQAMAERRILARMSHPFIVSLHYAFQNVSCLVKLEEVFILSDRFLSRRRTVLSAAQ
eukprot:TRINITY_DN2624_c0_g1_i10.p2 TRINITY_DN2624_c0_g1~~TRINITY_DN2624_c0_g1_i10.p2  ORF type:complete len:145 (-),score=33.12 TRINITY_DN2624_c0_g1_i10:11-445(-)